MDTFPGLSRLGCGTGHLWKRIRADVFYDWSNGKDILEGKDKWYTGTYQSAGGELLADFHAGRIILPFLCRYKNGIFVQYEQDI